MKCRVDLSTVIMQFKIKWWIIKGIVMEQTKEELLADIEELISYGRDEPTINPALLEYLEIEDLINTKAKLLERVGVLSDEDKKWLEQFKKYK